MEKKDNFVFIGGILVLVLVGVLIGAYVLYIGHNPIISKFGW